MLDELRALAQAFQDGDRILVKIYEPLWHKLGVTEEMARREFEKLKAGVLETTLAVTFPLYAFAAGAGPPCAPPVLLCVITSHIARRSRCCTRYTEPIECPHRLTT